MAKYRKIPTEKSCSFTVYGLGSGGSIPRLKLDELSQTVRVLSSSVRLGLAGYTANSNRFSDICNGKMPRSILYH